MSHTYQHYQKGRAWLNYLKTFHCSDNHPALNIIKLISQQINYTYTTILPLPSLMINDIIVKSKEEIKQMSLDKDQKVKTLSEENKTLIIRQFIQFYDSHLNKEDQKQSNLLKEFITLYKDELSSLTTDLPEVMNFTNDLLKHYENNSPNLFSTESTEEQKVIKFKQELWTNESSYIKRQEIFNRNREKMFINPNDTINNEDNDNILECAHINNNNQVISTDNNEENKHQIILINKSISSDTISTKSESINCQNKPIDADEETDKEEKLKAPKIDHSKAQEICNKSGNMYRYYKIGDYYIERSYSANGAVEELVNHNYRHNGQEIVKILEGFYNGMQLVEGKGGNLFYYDGLNSDQVFYLCLKKFHDFFKYFKLNESLLFISEIYGFSDIDNSDSQQDNSQTE